jgi:CheY-like chemotaxis protein
LITETHPPERRPHLIAVTADSTAETRMRCALAGMTEYVTKPLTLERLSFALERARAPVT